MTVTLFPIRLLIAAFMMLLAWPFAFLATIGRSETAVEPQCLWRRQAPFIISTTTPGLEAHSSSSHVHTSSFQTGRHHSEDHHAGHVVCGRLPLDDGERSEGVT